MTPAQEGAYIRLLCHAWRDPNCSLPDDDDALASLSRLGKGWLKGGSQVLRKCFEPHPTILHRLVNQRQLKERERWEHWKIKSAEGGVKSGESRRKKNGKGGSRVVEHEKENIKENMNRKDSPPGKLITKGKSIAAAEKSPPPTSGNGSAKEPDPYYELFAKAYEDFYGMPYPNKTGDFTQLAATRKAVGASLDLTGWAVAVKNYFASPMGKHTLADLASRYPTFHKYPLDEYKNPAPRVPDVHGTASADEFIRKYPDGVIKH